MSEHDTDAVVERVAEAWVRTWFTGDPPNGVGACSGDRRDVLTIISALKPGDRLPGGGVWMPEEPTNAMLARVGEYWGQDTGYCSPEDVRAIYRAMLKAAGDPA